MEESNNNNNTPPSNYRALYKRTSIPRSQEELRERRMVFDQSLRKKHREQLITAKRFRQLTHREEKESAGEPLPPINEHDGKLSFSYYKHDKSLYVGLYYRGYRSLLSSNTRASKCTGIRFEE